MRNRGAWVMLVTFTGCAPYYGERREAIASAANEETVHLRWADAPRGARCGTIAERLFNDASYAAFQAENCAALPDDECTDKLVDAFLAKMQLRYKRANLAEISTYCRAEPAQCDNPTRLERVWLASHNKTVEEHRSAAVAAVQEQESAEWKSRRRAFAAGMRDAARSMSGKPVVDCDPNGLGGVTCSER